MGNTKKLRKKYVTPFSSWDKDRIIEEKEYLKEYSLKNKKELWRMSSKLAKFKNIAKDVISKNTSQAEKEGLQLLNKLKSLGLLNETSMLNDVLTLTTKDILERRLQTVIFRKGLTHSVNQARQFITHSHIMVNGIMISSPSYLVKKNQEELIQFNPASSLSDLEHPERKIEKVSKDSIENKDVKNKSKDDKSKDDKSKDDKSKDDKSKDVKSKDVKSKDDKSKDDKSKDDKSKDDKSKDDKSKEDETKSEEKKKENSDDKKSKE
jgi:small subunit ribosomal protein S4